MKYKALRLGIILVSIGTWCLVRALQELQEADEYGDLQPGWDDGYRAGVVRGRADAAEQAARLANDAAEDLGR